MNLRTVLIALMLAATAQPRPAPTSIFVLRTDEMWLNLHHFLYVLGRDQAELSDRTRRAVVAAPEDARKGCATLAADDRRVWRGAVTFYANGPSRQDMIFDEPAIATVAALARAGASPKLAVPELDAALAATLERAAPIYQKTWWPSHQASNRAWVKEVEAALRQHGPAVLSFITRAYGLEWPAAGYPVHVSGYANWAGAYSTRANILVISSLDPDASTLYRLESVFHEAMHQWDDEVQDTLRALARAQGTRVPRLLSHAIIFYTAGEAVRSVAPGHVPYADRNGIWERGMGEFKPHLEAVWKPYLAGKGTRDAALAELVRRAGRPREPA